ncbi:MULTISPECIES: PQQ-binding-like beta-propeller repeat protein [Streptomyces]|uniref:PQQ-binding-like beta-propeller repeat protein n=1 Tax=Streptomyces changanensis TaxID=2964669 RepID=A0ABY5NEK0_9ACTN|nr:MULTISPECIES: PQQ-binding-like beta-propeller repeat protein [Streptomyces]UUS34420.1 PQQ-binding-like beta-propeller repeat protein [Streptomyces changanensis]
MKPRKLRWLVPFLAALLAVVSPMAPAHAAAAADCAGTGVERFGAASVSGAIVGAVVHEGRGYVVTRGQTPPILAEYDLATKKVVRQVPLTDWPGTVAPEGAWATVVSGGKIYIGTYPAPLLYRFDPATGKAQYLKTLGGARGTIWSLAAAPDGTIYAGTNPDGRVWEYDPADGAAKSWSLATGEHHVRAVAADATNVYAGLLDTKQLLAVNRSTGAVRVLAQGDTGFSTVSVGRTRLRAGSGSTLYDMKTDGSDVRKVSLGSNSADSIGVAPDYTAYISTRPAGHVFSYRTGDAAPTLVGTGKPQDETRHLAVDGTTLTGFAGSGGVWTMDLTTGRSAHTDLVAAGLAVGAERPHSILLHTDGTVWVGGHFGITVHDPAARTSRGIWVPGEPKAMARVGDRVYAALYPSGEILEIDPRDGDRVRSLGALGHGQQRPWDMEYDPTTGKLLVASVPPGPNLKGALTVIDPVARTMKVFVDVIRDQGLTTLSAGPNGVVYVGGDVLGGGTAVSTRSTAAVAAFDLATEKVLWETEPLPDNRTLQDVKVHDGLLYGVLKRNAGWFVLDLRTRQVLRHGTLSGYGEIEVHQGQVVASTYFGGGNVFLLGPGLAEPRKLATGLGDEWHTDPQLAFEPAGWHAWTLVGRQLARLRLDPACAPPLLTS